MKKMIFIFTLTLVALTAGAQSCPDDNHPHAIDLGLPSGTKWACCNVGAEKPEAYGGYFAWGEMEEKESYDWATYIHCDGSKFNCHNLGDEIAGTEYDVAHVRWGGLWQIPSTDQLQELRDNCFYEWTTENGVDGCKFTSKLNDSSVFLPAAGVRWESTLYDNGECGEYWLSTTSSSNLGCANFLHSLSRGSSIPADERCLGICVRPILMSVNNISLPKQITDMSNKSIYNINGIKVEDTKADINTLFPGLYIVNGKKVVVR